MIEEQALVVGIEGDAAVLEVVRKTPCGMCGQTRGCGASLFGKLLGHRNNVFKAVNSLSARIGDHVVIGVDEKALLASSVAVYGVPLGLMLAGAAIGTFLAPSGGDLWPLAGAGAGLSAGLLWLKAHSAAGGVSARFQPVILRQADAHSQIKICHRGQQ